MTDDPTARVRAAMTDALERPEAIKRLPGHLVWAIARDTLAALDAKDAEIERLKAENLSLRRDVAALRPGFRGDLTPADIGMVPVEVVDEGTNVTHQLWRMP